MTHRSPIVVALLSLLTFGIYQLYWMVATKDEANHYTGADVPSAWWMLVPFVNIWWMWRWAGGIERTTDRRLTQGVNFVLIWLTGFIGAGVIQSKINEAIAAAPGLPQARVV